MYKVLNSLYIMGSRTIGRKTIGRQRSIGRGGQSVAEGKSVAVDNRSLKDDRSQTIGRRVKILNYIFHLWQIVSIKNLGTEIRHLNFSTIKTEFCE